RCHWDFDAAVRECRLELTDDVVAFGRRRVARDEIVVVEIDAICAELAEFFDDAVRRDRGAHRIAEWIASDVADGPQTEGEVVFGAGSVCERGHGVLSGRVILKE